MTDDLRRIIWLASFPKSGNTWVRSVLANYFQPPDEALTINQLGQFTLSDARQEFFDRANGAPYRGTSADQWIALRPTVMKMIAASKPGLHFVKTHCQPGQVKGIDLIPPQLTASAIYVIRNPFDVILSYARHMNLTIDQVIERMADNMAYHATPTGIMEVTGRWDTHIQNWTTQTGPLRKHVMRYEDILAHERHAFQELFAFLELPIDKKRLKRVLNAASFKTLRSQEEAEGFRERPPHMDRFFATGRAGGWRQVLSPDQAGRVRREFSGALEKWYPEMIGPVESFAAGRAAS